MNATRRWWVCLILAVAGSSFAAPAAPRYKLVAYYLASPTPARYFSPDKIPATARMRQTHQRLVAFIGAADCS